jgi:hypothetical protein
MPAFRLLKATDKLHFLVAEEEAQMFDVLRRTTYKDSPTVQQAIDEMLKFKRVIHISTEDVQAHIGKACFFEEHETDLLEGTASKIATSTRGGSNRQNTPPTSDDSGSDSEDDEADSDETGYDKQLSPAEVKQENAGPLSPAEVKQENAGPLSPAEVKQENDGPLSPAEVKQMVNNVISGDGSKANSLGLDIDASSFMNSLVGKKGLAEDSLFTMGWDKLNPFAKALASLMRAFERSNPESQPNKTKSEKKAKIVHLPGYGDASLRMLMFLAGIQVVESLYLSTNTGELSLPKAIPGLDIIDTFSRVFFENHYAYVDETLNFWTWTRDMKNMDARISTVLKDEANSTEIQAVVHKLSNATVENLASMFRNLTKKEQADYVTGTATGEQMKQIWKNMQNDNGFFLKKFEEGDEIAKHTHQYGFVLSLGKLHRHKDYIQERGMFSNSHRYGPNDSIGMLMNNAKLYKGGFTPITDLCNIVRTVSHYMAIDHVLSNTGTVGETFKALSDKDSRVFRTDLWLSITVMSLFAVPAFGYTSLILDAPVKVKSSDWTYRGALLSLPDIFLVNRMFLVSFCQAKLLSEQMYDGNFELSKSFGAASLSWYYTTGVIELAVIGILKKSLYGAIDNTDVIERAFLVVTTAGVLYSFIDTDTNPDTLFKKRYAEMIWFPLASMAWTSVNGIWRVGRRVKNWYSS